jgi:hypothetical protein
MARPLTAPDSKRKRYAREWQRTSRAAKRLGISIAEYRRREAPPPPKAEPVPPKAEPVALVGREAAERLAPIRRDGDEPEAWRRGGVGLLGRFDR